MLGSRLSWATLGASLLGHVGAFSVMPTSPVVPQEDHSSQAEFIVLEAAPAAIAEPEQLKEPEPPPPQPSAPEPLVAPAPSPTPEPPEPAPAEDEPPSSQPQSAAVEDFARELAGLTLTADGGAWATSAGSGSERQGPLLRGVSKRVVIHAAPALAPRAQPVPAPAAPKEVALAELSKRPQPPGLAGLLQRNYPQSARTQGREGQARVRARVEPSGEIVVAEIASQSGPEFGQACLKTLVGSRWSKPIGPDGKPVRTWISYDCRFRVDR